MAKEIGEEYLSSLADLNVNSKPLINMLTILAEEYLEHASVIVQAVEQHLNKVKFMLTINDEKLFSNEIIKRNSDENIENKLIMIKMRIKLNCFKNS